MLFLGWGQKVEGVGCLYHLVCKSSIKHTTMYDAGHVIRQCSYASSYLLFTSLIFFFSLPVITVAISVSHSPPTQCGPFQVIWDDPVLTASMYILPLDDRPVNVDNRSIVHNTQTKTYNYTLNRLPLKTGTQFVVVLDYGSGALFSSPLQYTNSECSHDTILLAYVLLIDDIVPGVFVSSIQTVGDSSNSSCLSTDPEPMSSFFSLNPPVPSTCSAQIVRWNETKYQEPPEIRAFIPGGQAFKLNRPTTNTPAFTTWTVDMRAGSQVVLFVQPFIGGTIADSRTSPLITITANNTGHRNDCLSKYNFEVIVPATSATAASTHGSTIIISATATSTRAASTNEPTVTIR